VETSTVLSRLLRRERTIVAMGLIVLAALAWAYLAAGAGMGASAWETTRLSLFPHQTATPSAMEMPGMTMAGAAHAPAQAPSTWLLEIAMWWTMMIAMMVPSAAPTILLYERVRRHALAQAQRPDGLVPSAVFASGYLLVWLLFSILATGLHAVLQTNALVSTAWMSSTNRLMSAALLIAAGLYQLTPLKAACLNQCRAPAAFLSRYWRPGATGALRLGALHGAYCVGCCWALMALLFVGGVMNLAWIAALALLVMAEKLLPAGVWVGRAAAAILIAWGLATLAA
jgi:predicted metal-binding membrane protein